MTVSAVTFPLLSIYLLLLWLQTYTLQTWDVRNTVLHDNSPDSRLLVNSTTNYHINHIYQKKAFFPLSPINQQLFEEKSLLLKQSLWYRRQWLAQARLILDRSNDRFLLDQHLLTAYYKNFGIPSSSTSRSTLTASTPIKRFVQMSVPGTMRVSPNFGHRLRRWKRKLRRLRDTYTLHN